MSRATLRVSLAVGALSALTGLAGCNNEDAGTSVEAVRGAHGVGSDTSSDGALAARALINRDGTADFEATTGMLDDSTTPPGALNRLDLQVFNVGGTLLTSQRLSSPVGYLGSRLAGVLRGDPFHVDAMVTPPGGTSPRSATVLGQARLRPDLAFEIIGPERGGHGGRFHIIGPEFWARFGIIGPERGGIIGPERPRAGASVHLVTRPIELNRDVGAVTECVFRVNGAIAQTQTELAITAGGFTTCAVDYTFAHPGIDRVSFTLSNVKPGDYNDANNTVAGWIIIIGPEHGH